MLAIDPTGSRLLTVGSSIFLQATPFATATNKLDVWNVAAGKALLSVSLGSVRPGVALSPDGTRAAAIVSLDGKGDLKAPHGVKVWDINGKKEILFLKVPAGDPFHHLIFSPDGRKLAATGFMLGMGGIWIWMRQQVRN